MIAVFSYKNKPEQSLPKEVIVFFKRTLDIYLKSVSLSPLL